MKMNDDCLAHGLRTPNEGINLRNLKFCADVALWQTKYALAVLINLGLGFDFRPCVRSPWFSKEIVERRHREPIKVLFLHKMATKPVMKITLVMNFEVLLRAVFSCFHEQKFIS